MKSMHGDTPKISVIVPVYKVEAYLRRCVDSVLAQTFKDFELILVDDGSPDKCGEICEEYASSHPFISVIHQKNQGLSAARNNAVPMSRGEFITFVDSDDVITPDYLEYLYGLSESHHADVSVGGFIYQYEKRPLKKAERETEIGRAHV